MGEVHVTPTTKIMPVTRRPRWSVHINRVHMLLSCEQALMQYKQTITNGRDWASHLRQLVAASYMHTNLDNTSNDCDLENEIGDARVTSMHERAMWVSHLLKIVNIRQIERQLVNVRQLVDASRAYMQSYKAPTMMPGRQIQKHWNRTCWWELSSESKDRMDMMCRGGHVRSHKQWMGGFTWSWIVITRRIIWQIVNVRQLASHAHVQPGKVHNDGD